MSAGTVRASNTFPVMPPFVITIVLWLALTTVFCEKEVKFELTSARGIQ